MECIIQYSKARHLGSGKFKAKCQSAIYVSSNPVGNSSCKARASKNSTFSGEINPPSFASPEGLFGDVTAPVNNIKSEIVRFAMSGNCGVKNTRRSAPRRYIDLPTTIINLSDYEDTGWLGIDDEDVYGTITPVNHNTIYVNNPTVTFGGCHLQGQPEFSFSQIQSYDNTLLKAFSKLATVSIHAALNGAGSFVNKYADKFAGFFNSMFAIKDVTSKQILYPIADRSNNSFVNEKNTSSGIYASLDNGIFTGHYLEHLKDSFRTSDDLVSFITPSSVTTDGTFSYSCEVTSPLITPKDSLIFFRISAPIKNIESNKPSYRIYDISFTDPSGNLISEYKDILLKGDQEYSELIHHNYATYVTEPKPKRNYAKLNTWLPEYPFLDIGSGYLLNFKVDGYCNYDPFAEGFNLGYEEGCIAAQNKAIATSKNDYLSVDGSPMSTMSQGYDVKPMDSIRISNVELHAYGSKFGWLWDDKINFFTEVQPTGNRLERSIQPTQFLFTNYSNDIHPSGIESVWKTSPNIDQVTFYSNNRSNNAPYEFIDRLTNLYVDGNIELHSVSNSPTGSGKLQLIYEHKPPFSVAQQTGGAFSFGNKFTNQLDSSTLDILYPDDNLFIADEVFLRVKARKPQGVDSFPIDVVAYSDDGVLFRTPQQNGFLQNATSGVGVIPQVSGYLPSNDLGISAVAASQKENYYAYPKSRNVGGDHYRISSDILIDSEDFKTYDIPLKITHEHKTLGVGKKYDISNYFEKLYVDIYPIPVGAIISSIDIIVKHAPAAGLALSSLAHLEKEIANRKETLRPDKRSSSRDRIFNSLFTNTSSSALISGIPHAYTTPDTLKTNYSRRWRGCSGNTIVGPFDPVEFDYSFYKPQLEQPFLLGFFDFQNLDGNHVLPSFDPSNTNCSGQFSGDLASSLFTNLGWRFNSSKLFNHQELPYTTTDWTFQGHELYGHIIDAFHAVARISGVDGYFDFGDRPVNSGFAIYTRFTPDIDVSGVNYNLFDSGVLASKWDSGKDLEFSLHYSGGHLCASARTSSGDLIRISDPSSYEDYQYPLSVVLTYNDNNSRKLKLYTNNEIAQQNNSRLRAISDSFVIHSGTSNICFGYSSGSGVGMNCFISEMGISDYHPSGGGTLVGPSSLVETSFDTNDSLQQDNIFTFFDGQHSKFWTSSSVNDYEQDSYELSSFVDEATDDWYLGSIKYCEFNNAYDIMKKRVGKDFIYHNFSNNNTSYEDITDLDLPSNINLSGIAYHSQIENDMLRLNLSGKSDRFHAIPTRISKKIPRGYNFLEDALVVNTVIQHEADSSIVWADGKVGAKLIVSLYTPRKESEVFDTTNWGLINRSTHYLNPEDCWNKIRSNFTLSDFTDRTSEPWSFFPQDNAIQEFSSKYYSNDIETMFVQYDVVYPSGSYKSQIKIHSLDVHLEDALLKSETIDNSGVLYVSGQYIQREHMPLAMPSPFDTINNSFDPFRLYASGSPIITMQASGNLFTSGVYQHIEPQMNLYSRTIGAIGNDQNFGSENFGALPYGLYLKTIGGYDNTQTSMGMYCLPLDTTGLNQETINMTLGGDMYFAPSVSMDLLAIGDYPQSIFSLDASFGLLIRVVEPEQYSDSSINLYLSNFIPEEMDASTSINLYTEQSFALSKRFPNALEFFVWNSGNVGSSITVSDNIYASLDADDEIRGVSTMCYGGCGISRGCKEPDIVTHDTKWYDPECINGGVFRAIATYTNPSVSGFFEYSNGYDKNYYGIRKFTNLFPSSPYILDIVLQTGSDKILEVPRTITEWEYGTNEDVDFSGVQITAPSNSVAVENNYGKALTVLGDMMAIGSPNKDVFDPYENITLQKAGSVFVYRRNPEPSGYDWTNQPDKSSWYLDQELALPTGWRRDYNKEVTITFTDNKNKILPYTGIRTDWYVGQEGREMGYSLASAKRESTEIIAAGAPGALFSRTFPPLILNPVKIALFVFNDEIVTNSKFGWQSILDKIENKDNLYKYFCEPAVEFDVSIILCEPILGTDALASEPFNTPAPDFIYQRQMHRHFFQERRGTVEYKNKENLMLQELKDIYHEIFPLTANVPHSGLPAIVGFYVDDSVSLGAYAVGHDTTGFYKGALDRFSDYVSTYSYDNGLQDFSGNPANPYITIKVDTDENWQQQSSNILDTVTETGVLIANNAFRLFASNLGTFNEGLQDFNTTPPSGGAVFIFEKDENSSEFSFVQEINSPTLYYDDVSDRFGHDVALSEDGKILVIGSPFCENAVQILEYDPSRNINNNNGRFMDLLKSDFTSWLDNEAKQDTSFGPVYLINAQYQQDRIGIISTDTLISLLRDTFNSLPENYRYKFIKDFDLQPYRLIKEITYSDIGQSKGGVSSSQSWDVLFNNIVPTSRLGYSVDTNEDGSVVVVGSPTDSLGARDSTQTFFRYDQRSSQETQYGGEDWQWQNYTNAGCIRILESWKYYPHYNKAVEYFKFGNLHETLSPDEDKHLFNETMSRLYSSVGIDFTRTDFSEDVKIPSDAGLAFIITPEIDAASEEIINNIKEWLSLGDRNLVLVANDPIWENDGLYSPSNNIINYILSELDINLRVHPARNKEHAVVEPPSFEFNIIPSFVPSKTTSTYVTPSRLMGSGVADIRFYDPNVADYYNCEASGANSSDPFSFDAGVDKLPYRQLNDKCELPIIHNGDLRAKYIDQCEYVPCFGEPAWLNYERNLAYAYGTHTECHDWECYKCEDPCPTPLHYNLRNASEPIPIMVAAEKAIQTVNIPETPPSYAWEKVVVGFNTNTNLVYNPVEDSVSGVTFMWSHSSGNYTDLKHNINNTVSDSLFYDPEEYNGRNCILQAQAQNILNIQPTDFLTEPLFTYAAEDHFKDELTSSVVLIAGTLTEDRNILLSSAGDKNINFYFNILAKDEFGSSKVAQVGDFTGHASYRDAFSTSDLKSRMSSMGIDMNDLNVSTKSLYLQHKSYDIAWIANPSEYPTSENISDLKKFLKLGNKKIVITLAPAEEDINQDSSSELDQNFIRRADIVTHICNELNLTIKPLFLEGKNKYASTRDTQSSKSWDSFENGGTSNLIWINQSNVEISQGYRANSSPSSKIITYTVEQEPINRNGEATGFNVQAIPIKASSQQMLAFFETPVFDVKGLEFGTPMFKTGITKVSFDVPPMSGNNVFNTYRLFFDYVSETSAELQPIYFNITNCIIATDIKPQDEFDPPVISRTAEIPDFDIDSKIYYTKVISEVGGQLDRPSTSPTTQTLDIQFPSGTSSFDIYFNYSRTMAETQSPDTLRTCRLISISGAPIEMERKFFRAKPIFSTVQVEIPGTPARSYDVEITRPISSPSDQYCRPENQCALDQPKGYGTPGPMIADGPMVVAQAIYHQGGYNSGFNKSRVTVISDPSLIQGKSIINKDGNIHSSLTPFLQSLYPSVSEYSPLNDVIIDSTFSAREYPSIFKIVSPERNSPSRLINAYPNNSGLNVRFGGYQSNELSLNKFSDTEGEKEILPPTGQKFVRRPFDGMYALLQAGDIGKFTKAPIPPRVSPEEIFANGGLVNGMNKEEFLQAWLHDYFETVASHYGSYSKFKEMYAGNIYEDAGMYDSIPPLMRATGKDHLDLDVMISGYPGDLFGYSVKIHKNKIYVGSPFCTYDGTEIVNWNKVLEQDTGSGIYGTSVGYNGGAGAVYVLEKDYINPIGIGTLNFDRKIISPQIWGVTQKIRPTEINVGHSGLTVSSASGVFGSHTYSQDFLDRYAHVSDMFGSKIALDGDVLAISAPGHDFETFFERTSGEFVRKEFNEQFNIPSLVPHDLGVESERLLYANSGVSVLNHGAVFTYENKISDWGSKSQEWVKIAKLTPQGSNARIQNSGENLFSGQDIALYRNNRVDSDYILLVSAKNHPFVDNQNVDKAGAIYTFDAMLRKDRPAFAHPDNWIGGKLFGSLDKNYPNKFRTITFRQNNNYLYDEEIKIRDYIYSNNLGEIFIEASGQDFSNGYVIHRPYIKSIKGAYLHGSPEKDQISLFSTGKSEDAVSTINLFNRSEDSRNVYNKVGLYGQGAYGAIDVKPFLLYSSGDILSVNNSVAPFGLFASGGFYSLFNTLNIHSESWW